MFFAVYKISKELLKEIKPLNMFSDGEITFIKEGHNFNANVNGIEVEIRLLSRFMFIKVSSTREENKTLHELEKLVETLFDGYLENFMPYTNQEKRFYKNMDKVKSYYWRSDNDYNEYIFSSAGLEKDGISFTYMRSNFSTDNEKDEEKVKKMYEKFFTRG